MPADPRVDAYIARSAPFARPILTHLRAVVHAACPDAEEKMKWSFPHFDYNGRMMCSMAAFKEHAVFTFWNGRRMKDPHHVMEKAGSTTAMGHFGRITNLSDLPRRNILISYIKEAMRLNEGGPAAAPRTYAKKAVPKRVRPPSYLGAALKKNAKAGRAFERFPPGQQREYIEWLTEARTRETRDRRLAWAIEWIAEGKYRNWKYGKRRTS